jgi:hypothetical protein
MTRAGMQHRPVSRRTNQGVRGDEKVFDPSGTPVAEIGTTVTYLHEAPFTASSFKTTTQTTNPGQPQEYEPFGSEIPTTPPLNVTPDWIVVGNYQQTGNPLDAQGGCLEDGFPTDCSAVIQKVCVGNPRCMNRDSRMGGLGYFLAGMSSRGGRRGWRVSYKAFGETFSRNYSMAQTGQMIGSLEGGETVTSTWNWSSLSMHPSVSGGGGNNTNCYTYYQMIYENPFVQKYINDVWEATVASTKQVYEASGTNSSAGAPEFAGIVTINAKKYTHAFWGVAAVKREKDGFDISPQIENAQQQAKAAGGDGSILLEIHSHIPEPIITSAIGPYVDEKDRPWFTSWDPNLVTAHPGARYASGIDHFRGASMSWVGLAVYGKGKFGLYGKETDKEKLKTMCVPGQNTSR